MIFELGNGEKYAGWETDFLTARLSRLGKVHPDDFKKQLFGATRELGRLLPQDLERILRLLESDIYLIADSVRNYYYGHGLLPHTGTKEYSYVVGMTMAGLDVAMERYQERRVTPEQNMWRLGNAGILVPRYYPVFPTQEFEESCG